MGMRREAMRAASCNGHQRIANLAIERRVGAALVVMSPCNPTVNSNPGGVRCSMPAISCASGIR
jgi:hypothetical protein